MMAFGIFTAQSRSTFLTKGLHRVQGQRVKKEKSVGVSRCVQEMKTNLWIYKEALGCFLYSLINGR